jgi:hypothetical protein
MQCAVLKAHPAGTYNLRRKRDGDDRVYVVPAAQSRNALIGATCVDYDKKEVAMNLCPNCLHAVPDDLERCPFCSEELEPGEGGRIDEKVEWTIVRTVSTEIEAQLVAGRLRANGIPAFVLSQVDSTRNFTVGALAVAKVFVPEALVDEAKRVLATPVDAAADQEELRQRGEGGSDSR